MNEWSDPCERSGDSAGRRSAALCVIVAAMAFASACIAVQISRRDVAGLQARAESADQAWNDAARQAQQVLDLRDAQRAIAQHAEQADALLEKMPRSAVLADVTNALPAGCWLEDVRLDSSDAGDDALHVQLAGLAPGDGEIGQYVARLRQTRRLQNVKLSASQAEQEQGRRLRRFRIDFSVGDTVQPATPTAQPTVTASIGH
jgi:Tfp pilus assembly protein PilN